MAGWQAVFSSSNISAVPVARCPTAEPRKNSRPSVPAASLAKSAAAWSMRGPATTISSTGRSTRLTHPSSAKGGLERADARLRAAGLRDRNDLKLLTSRACDIAHAFTHQGLRHRRGERDRAGFGIGFVFSDDAILLHTAVIPFEGHRAAKGNDLG